MLDKFDRDDVFVAVNVLKSTHFHFGLMGQSAELHDNDT